MIFILKQFKEILITTMCLLFTLATVAQQKRTHTSSKHGSSQLQDFNHLITDADVQFTFPAGFKEIPVVNNEDFSYDYAMEIPNHGFDIWLMIKPQKGEWESYERLKDDANKQLTNPDSLYASIGRAQAAAFSGDTSFVAKTITPEVLSRYNASAGKSYILNMQDFSSTKHYKYALLLTLRKDHEGTILAVCFTNEKNAEFFRNVSGISKYLKFKP